MAKSKSLDKTSVVLEKPEAKEGEVIKLNPHGRYKVKFVEKFADEHEKTHKIKVNVGVVEVVSGNVATELLKKGLVELL